MLGILQILLYRVSLQIDVSSIIKKNNSNIYLLVVEAHQSHMATSIYSFNLCNKICNTFNIFLYVIWC